VPLGRERAKELVSLCPNVFKGFSKVMSECVVEVKSACAALETQHLVTPQTVFRAKHRIIHRRLQNAQDKRNKPRWTLGRTWIERHAYDRPIRSGEAFQRFRWQVVAD